MPGEAKTARWCGSGCAKAHPDSTRIYRISHLGSRILLGYVGDKVDGKRHGEGTYTYEVGRKYVGTWKNDVRHGEGTYIPESPWSNVD